MEDAKEYFKMIEWAEARANGYQPVAANIANDVATLIADGLVAMTCIEACMQLFRGEIQLPTEHGDILAMEGLIEAGGKRVTNPPKDMYQLAVAIRGYEIAAEAAVRNGVTAFHCINCYQIAISESMIAMRTVQSLLGPDVLDKLLEPEKHKQDAQAMVDTLFASFKDTKH